MITLSVNGRTYSNWTAATIERSLENISGAFNLEIGRASCRERV